MQPTIHLLSEEAINQIAAGEVIESPASVVKELVENSLDAGAKKITIEITGGGLKLIRIIDDGKGMHREDAKLSIQRHATSKITRPEDLFRIPTKGFRGEALAAIGSISKMTLITARDGESGTELEIDKGEILKISSCARTKGTTVEIRSLFYCVPARKKFQKAAPVLSAEIFRMVSIMSLSHPEVGFELISNGKKVIHLFPGELRARAHQLLGEDFTEGSYPVSFEQGPFVFQGLLGAPTQNRINKTNQYLFINKRAVHCRAIEEAVREGYGTRLDEKRHPIFLLHLTIPSDLVDVNVHPQKLQVRLRQEELISSKVIEAIQLSLADVKKPAPMPAVDLSAPFEEWKAKSLSFNFQEEASPIEYELNFPDKDFEIVGQFGPFLFLEGWSVEPDYDGIVAIDLKAALFRITFEEMLNSISPPEKQGLLIPFSFSLTPIESAMVLTHLNAIEDLGFHLKPIGKDTFMVEALPSNIEQTDVKNLVANLAISLQDFIGKIDYERERKEKLALLTAGFVKSKNHFSKEEAIKLFGKLRSCQSPLHCPKGNPTMVHLSHETLQNLFRTDSWASKKT